jgi:cell division septation protein DedD
MIAMDRSVEQTLIECLEALDRGEAIGEILSRYPEAAAELRPILETAAQLTTLNLQPTVAAQAKSQEAFLAQAAAIKGMHPARRRPFFSFWLRPLATMAFLAILLVGFINFSAKALPGDTLYGAKLFFEDAQLTFTGDGVSLEERFRQNRIAEIENLLRQNREANVTFTGVVDEMMSDTWRIEGLAVTVAAANIDEEPHMGDMVEVNGWVGNGRLVANTITVTMKNETHPPYETEATETPSPTATVEPTPTVSPTRTTTPSPTPQATITPTPTATSTNTPQPNPDPVPTHEEDDNSGPGGGDDDNSGPGSNNSGSGSDDDNSGSGSSNSGSSNSGSGSDNSGSGSNDDNGGSGNDHDDD